MARTLISRLVRREQHDGVVSDHSPPSMPPLLPQLQVINGATMASDAHIAADALEAFGREAASTIESLGERLQAVEAQLADAKGGQAAAEAAATEAATEAVEVAEAAVTDRVVAEKRAVALAEQVEALTAQVQTLTALHDHYTTVT